MNYSASKFTLPHPRLTPDGRAFRSLSMGPEADANVEMSFEDALKRLEEIVHRLESGDESLENAINLYGEGDRLRALCEKRLADAQARIEKLTLGADGKPVGAQPFDAP